MTPMTTLKKKGTEVVQPSAQLTINAAQDRCLTFPGAVSD